MNPNIAQEAAYGARNYSPLPVVLTRGEGVRLWDTEGHEYLDMMSAYSAVSFGHGHPRLVAALTAQAGRLAVTSRAFYSDTLGPFLQQLCQTLGMDRALPMNTGAEAVETAIKAARKWAYRIKGVAANQAEIITCEGNFAGRTTTIVSFSTEAQYRDGFGPYTPGFVTVPYGDLRALEAAITPNTAAFFVEPIQGEAGIIVPPAGYLKAAAALCRAHNVLFIADEIQTGLGRTGALLACHHEGVVPDAVTLGKALGGGLLPVSALVGRRDLIEVFSPGDHGSTFGGNALAAAVGLEALSVLADEHLAERAAIQGERLMAGLRQIDSPLVTAVRGRGLLVGVVFDPALVRARVVCERLMRYGVLTKETHETVVRLAPPLIVSAEEIDQVINVLQRVIDELEGELLQPIAPTAEIA